MRRSATLSLVMLAIILLLASCAAPGQGPMTWLDRPLDGSQLPLGPVTILAHASDADGVASFEFFVDEDSLATVPADGGRLGEATAGWNPTEPGTYTVRARATDSAGNTGSEATAVVKVGEVQEPFPTPLPEPSEGEMVFFVEPELIPPGACAVLRWEVNPPADALLDGEGVPAAGEREVCPETTTTYELIVPEREQARTVTLHVEGAPAEPEEVGIFFAVDPDAIPQGGCATLIWEVGAPEEWATLIEGSVVPHVGQQEVCPTTTRTYELVVETPNGPQTRSVTLHVESSQDEPVRTPEPTSAPARTPEPTPPFVPSPTAGPGCPGAPVISYFQAKPSTITAGQSATLQWGAVTNGNSSVLVRSVVINPGLGEVGSPGSRDVQPASTTTYTMVATGCGGTTTQQVTVNVNPAVCNADLAITDLRPQTPSGPVWGDITNHGPSTVTNETLYVYCNYDETDPIEGTTRSDAQGTYIPIASLSPGQTTPFNTSISLTQGYQYAFSCKLDWDYMDCHDPAHANNYYSESFP
jgi:hypothetical protein